MLEILIGATKLNPYFTEVSITKEIDGVSSFTFNYPSTDEYSNLLTKRSIITVNYNSSNIFTGIITNITNNIDSYSLTISGTSVMKLLSEVLLPPNRLLYNQLLTDVLNPTNTNTVILNNSFNVNVESLSDRVTYLVSLQSSLNSLSTLAKLAGYHYRYDNNYNVSVFKSIVSSNITVQESSNSGNYSIDDKTLIIDGSISYTESADGLYNYAYAVAGTSDNGLNQLTLRDVESSIIDPNYPIVTAPITPNTDTTYDSLIYSNSESAPNTYVAYVVKSLNSITKYGQIDKAVTRKDLYTLSNNSVNTSNADRVTAANQLYLAVKSDMELNDEVQKIYQFNATGGFINMNVGQKIRLKFNKSILNTGIQAGSKDINIDDEFVLNKYTIQFEQNSVFRYSLEVSNIAKFAKDETQIIADALQTLSDYDKQRKGSVTTYPQYFSDSFDKDNPLEGLLWIPDDFQYMNKLKAKIKITPFRAYEKGGFSQTTTVPAQVVTSTTAQSTTTTSQFITTTSSTTFIKPQETSSSTASHTHTLTHSHGVNVNIGSGLTPNATPLFFDGYLSPSLRVAGGYNGVFGGIGTTTSVSTTSTSNGNHAHTIPQISVTIPGQNITIPAQTLTIPAQNITVNIPPLTIPGQSLSIEYGIYKDTSNPPTGLKLFVDGVDYSSEIVINDGFGINPTGNTSYYDIALASAKLNKFSELFSPGIHTIELKCDSGRARAELHFFGQFFLVSK